MGPLINATHNGSGIDVLPFPSARPLTIVMSFHGSFDALPGCIGRCGEDPDTVLYTVAGENRIALAVHVRHQTLIRQVANPGVRFLLAREDADLNKRNSGKRNFAPISANTGLPGALVSAI
jgi:hypothetical protein